jgi:hypothetical protein
MSLSDYALDADAFRGISPEDKSSWATIGAAFNTEVFGEVEANFADIRGGLLPAPNGAFQISLFFVCT